MKRKAPGCSLSVMAVSLLGSWSMAASSPSNPSFIFPQDGQDIAGTVLIWAVDPDSSVETLVFETSVDGEQFHPLRRQEAPDFGPFSHTTTLDSSHFPIGLLFLRARIPSAISGPVIRLFVHRLPQPSCVEPTPGPDPLLAQFDCSESAGEIVSYQWHFGDGTVAETEVPSIDHRYPGFGEFPFQLTVVDVHGFSSTFLALVTIAGDQIQWSRTRCSCERIVISAAGNSSLNDPRRNNPGPLGADPIYVSLNFEVSVTLEPGSDPALCEEGQQVKRTSTFASDPAEHKKACSAGRELPRCSDNSDCDSHTCIGGTQTGTDCEDEESEEACTDGGGQCASNNNGICSEYPLDGSGRGNDDYRSPADFGVKRHCPTCESPIWWDGPGTADRHEDLTQNFRYDADFLMFMRGENSCQCHVTLTIDWDGANQVYRAATGIQLIRDEDTFKCDITP